ncbi:hypothetical protein [Janthinobacterium sp. 67]|uniref:hypothetical protein n=1 Tax=Janthinobacterium sp. 67 TaxID=2035207 RepID=UPI0012FDF7DF|nr:hypothetical protein [Janthinobacterium sp. 67]
MRLAAHYYVEFETLGKKPTQLEFRSLSEDDVLTFSIVNLKPESGLFVACLGDGIDYGNFTINVDAQGRAAVQAHEHRGFFVDGLTVETAINALKYWLPLQVRKPEIQWMGQ